MKKQKLNLFNMQKLRNYFTATNNHLDSWFANSISHHTSFQGHTEISNQSSRQPAMDRSIRMQHHLLYDDYFLFLSIILKFERKYVK